MSDGYRVQHLAPSDDGYSQPILAVREQFGEDFLEQPDLYGSVDEQIMQQVRDALDGAPTVRIYRAVPEGSASINDGDWVTLSRAYAHDHGWDEDPSHVMPVVAADVPVTAVYTDGNDPSEWGYVGPSLSGLTPMREGDPEVAGTTKAHPGLSAAGLAQQAFPSSPSAATRGQNTSPTTPGPPRPSSRMQTQGPGIGY